MFWRECAVHLVICASPTTDTSTRKTTILFVTKHLGFFRIIIADNFTKKNVCTCESSVYTDRELQFKL